MHPQLRLSPFSPCSLWPENCLSVVALYPVHHTWLWLLGPQACELGAYILAAQAMLVPVSFVWLGELPYTPASVTSPIAHTQLIPH